MMRFDLTAECLESEAMEQDDCGAWVRYSDTRTVYVLHEKDGFGGMCINRIYSSKDAAIRHVMDDINHLLNRDCWNEERLRAHAKEYIEEHVIYYDY